MVIQKDDNIIKTVHKKGTASSKDIKDDIRAIVKSSKTPLNEDTLFAALVLQDEMRTQESILRLILDGTIKAIKDTQTIQNSDEPINIDDFLFYIGEEEEELKRKKPKFRKLFEKREKEINQS